MTFSSFNILTFAGLFLHIEMQNGQYFLDNLPEKPGKERDDFTFEAAVTGMIYCNWIPIASKITGYESVFYVNDDAFRADLNDGSRFRPQVSAFLAQRIADALGLMLPTAKLMDLSYEQADTKLDCITLPAGPEMVLTSRSIEYNKKVEKTRNGATGLIRDCGKAWILGNRLGDKISGDWRALNYGYYDKKAPSLSVTGNHKMWQSIGGHHNALHQDQSQTLHLIRPDCLLNGQPTTLIDILKDPKLAQLASHEGTLSIFRQPGVPLPIDLTIV